MRRRKWKNLYAIYGIERNERSKCVQALKEWQTKQEVNKRQTIIKMNVLHYLKILFFFIFISYFVKRKSERSYTLAYTMDSLQSFEDIFT